MPDSNTLSETSGTENSTLEPESILVEKVIEILASAASDAIALKDYLSFSTLIDIYLGDPSQYTDEERELLLDQLLKILTSSKELTYEIAWDLPTILIPFMNSDYDFSGPLRSAPCIYKVLKLMEILATDGNPKELFLKSCELLTTIKLDDPALLDNWNIRENLFDVKIYCIFELIDSCMKRIKTLYPSRFLAMTVASFVNLVYTNPIKTTSNYHFILKRAYSFARNYNTLPLPDNVDDEENLESIKESEEMLQRRLLTAFITQTVYLVGERALLGLARDHFSHLLGCTITSKHNFDSTVPVMNRMYELALSYDLELSATFTTYLKDANELLGKIDYTGKDVTGEVFERILIDYQTNIAHVIVNSDAKTINDSIPGILTLYTYHIVTSRQFNEVSLSISDAIAISLRALIPGMVRQSFASTNIQDIVVFWSWYSMYEKPSLQVELSKVEPALLTIYYQVLLYVISVNEYRSNFRYITLTLLTKVLALSPESTAYLFLKDSLHNCPYDSVKAILVGIFKELLTKDKRVHDLADDLKKVRIYDEEPKTVESSTVEQIAKSRSDFKVDVDTPTKVQETPTKVQETSTKTDYSKADTDSSAIPSTKSSSKAPPLPSRNSTPATKFFTLDEEKLKDIFELIEISIEETFIEENGTSRIDPQKLSTLSAYLNLLVTRKREPLFIENKTLLDETVDKVEQNIAQIRQKYEKTESNLLELNAAEMLNITIERIKS